MNGDSKKGFGVDGEKSTTSTLVVQASAVYYFLSRNPRLATTKFENLQGKQSV